MSQFHGSQYAGAMRDRKKSKREDADERNAVTLPTSRRKHRRALTAARAILDRPVTA